MTARIFDYLRLIGAYTRANVKAQLEYRGAFFSQVIAMFINDGTWVLFWMFFFTRFPVLRGWGLTDVIALWAVTAAGFGIAFAVMGNALNLASVIVKGDLDVWLSHPRAVLPHLLVGRSVPSAWGDAAFGYVVYLAFVRPDPMRIAMFTVLTFAVALVFVGVGIVAGSISFFIGNASAFADEWKFAVVTFATYPPTLFEGAVKVLLFTLIPAGFVSYVPVEGLRSLSWMYVGISFGAAIAILALSAGVFYLGLRRYESGNLILMNG